MDEETKRGRVVQELSQAGLQPNVKVSQDELYRVLDRKSVPFDLPQGGQFDRGVGAQLLQKINDGSGRVSPNEFSNVWVEAEKRLLDKTNLSQVSAQQLDVVIASTRKSWVLSSKLFVKSQENL